jgi:transcriptional regulator GlxA family with amidase domain
MKRVIFAVHPDVEILDLAGPMQVFHEAAAAGAPYRMVFAAQTPRLDSEQGLGLCGLVGLPHDTGECDLVIVPGSAVLRKAATAPCVRCSTGCARRTTQELW